MNEIFPAGDPDRPHVVLVVDDEEVNLTLLSSVLARGGHAALVARNRVEALEIAMRERLDAILMDIQMSVMDGLEASRRIRQLPPPSGTVPIIGLTANFHGSKLPIYEEAGMTACFPKPIHLHLLADALWRYSRVKPFPLLNGGINSVDRTTRRA